MDLAPVTRDIRIEIAFNVRHLGGYRTASGGETPAHIVRSASLHRLTDAGVAQLADAGIRTVVDLRSSQERERDATPDLSRFGINAVWAPVFDADASPVGLAEEFPRFATVYRRMLDSGRASYRTLFTLIANEEGGVLFHCAAGKDRTGVAAALLLLLAGVERATVVEDYSRSAELLRPAFEQWVERVDESGMTLERATALMASNPEDMEATLDYIYGRWGGADGYLEEIGLTRDALSALKSRLGA